MTSQKLFSMFKKTGLIVLGLIALSLFTYILVIRPLQIRHQKQNFDKAEASLDQLYNQIVAKVGKPDQYKKDKVCSYISQEFGKGPRNCHVSIYLLFENKDSAASTSLMNRVSFFSMSQLKSERLNSSLDSFKNYLQIKGPQTFDQKYSQIGNVQCGISYSYPVHPTYATIDPIMTKANENLQIELACSGPAMAEFYTVKN